MGHWGLEMGSGGGFLALAVRLAKGHGAPSDSDDSSGLSRFSSICLLA